jgi:hypothetical protein
MPRMYIAQLSRLPLGWIEPVVLEFAVLIIHN